LPPRKAEVRAAEAEANAAGAKAAIGLASTFCRGRGG
jgi:hypothetical protein